MDWTSMVAVGGSFVLGIGIVGAFLEKVLPKVTKALSIARETLELLDDVVGSIKDGKLEQAEVDRIRVDIAELKAAFKA